MNFRKTVFTITMAGCFICAIPRNQVQPGHQTLPMDSIPQVDTVVARFMKKYDVPGMSIAIAKDGKLVYAKGYGYANKATGEKVTPSHLFRIASVSKPITAVAVLQLVETGRLSLDAKVFGDGGILRQ
jgi:D-alanyl-D-alanine carboxypeptidase